MTHQFRAADLRRAAGALFLIAVFAGCPACRPAAETRTDVVPAGRAREYRDRVCTVELTVKASKHETDKRIYYLDSEVDYTDAANLAIVISEADMEHFRMSQITDPAAHYRNHVIRVTGTVIFNDDQFQMWVSDPAQIETVDP